MRETATPEVEQLVRGEHHEPHAFLGRHETSEGVVIRVFRPDAVAARVIVDGAEVDSLSSVHAAGLFVGTFDADVVPWEYEIEVEYAAGDTYRFRDPYSFLPSLGDVDLHLIGEGRHEELYQKLGAHLRTIGGVEGTSFAVWAPAARSVRVVGDHNGWDGRLHPMRSLGSSGIWEVFVPGVGAGARYKFEILTQQGWLLTKIDPVAQATEEPPRTASIVTASSYTWNDGDWLARRAERNAQAQPMSIYEVHLGSWRRKDDGSFLSYRDAGDELAAYCRDMGFTHVQFLPLMEHPFSGSWGYQVTGYFAPTARFGSPDDIRYMVDRLHQEGIGVLVDWVPAHFPKDEWALGRFDGTALYEHADPRQGEHPDWGTFVFNFGRNEVRNFLVASALYWLDELHFDGLRVDAVASMLYLDYSREEGEWVPNVHGGRENLEAIEFLKELNAVVHGRHPGALMVAEESTAWPGVSRPTWAGGLGFGFKWNMGWMHDTLDYFSHEPIHRRFHHHQLTFALIYAWHENFILPLSHDEVVHGKRSLIGRMPGDRWQELANLRALYGYMWAHPGKQLLFMGGEFAQSDEWNAERSLDWHLLQYDEHQGVQRLVRDLNHAYRDEPAIWEVDFAPEGFAWIDANNADDNVFSFLRYGHQRQRVLACIANLSPVPRHGIRVGLPRPGRWREVLNTDAASYGGSNVGNQGAVFADDIPWNSQPCSAMISLPPLATIWLVPDED